MKKNIEHDKLYIGKTKWNKTEFCGGKGNVIKWDQTFYEKNKMK